MYIIIVIVCQILQLQRHPLPRPAATTILPGRRGPPLPAWPPPSSSPATPTHRCRLTLWVHLRPQPHQLQTPEIRTRRQSSGTPTPTEGRLWLWPVPDIPGVLKFGVHGSPWCGQGKVRTGWPGSGVDEVGPGGIHAPKVSVWRMAVLRDDVGRRRMNLVAEWVKVPGACLRTVPTERGMQA